MTDGWTVQNVNARILKPLIHKRNNIYYLSYAVGYPSTTEYCTSNSNKDHGPIAGDKRQAGELRNQPSGNN